MPRLFCIAALLFIGSRAAAQPAPAANTTAAQEGIRNLTRELNDAALKRDRAALEGIYAPEFVVVHAYGYVDDRATQIEEILTRKTDAPFPFPVPSFDSPNQLLVIGEVVIFRRPTLPTDDGSPAWSTMIYVKRDGRYQLVQVQATEMQRERQWVTLSSATLDGYAGRYRGGTGQFVTVQRAGDTLVVDLPWARVVLRATAEDVFYEKGGGEWRFYRGPDGKVTHYVWRARGQERRVIKVE